MLYSFWDNEGIHKLGFRLAHMGLDRAGSLSNHTCCEMEDQFLRWPPYLVSLFDKQWILKTYFSTGFLEKLIKPNKSSVVLIS